MSAITLPPDWNEIEKHAMMPEATHDEVARFNFLANLNKYLATVVSPANRTVYEERAKPQFEDERGRSPETRDEVREAMQSVPYYQFWSALRRNTMEMRQQAGRSMVLRQANALANKAEMLNDDKPTLQMDPDLEVPHYLDIMDNHIMPGSYHTEYGDGDVSNAANYDAGIFVTTGGALGPLNDGGGRALAVHLKQNYPDFQPRRILDIGAGLGHNTLPLAQAYPDAEVVAVEVGAPMVRYGHARAQALGVDNVTFVQANAEDLDYEDESFDYVQTVMFLHETSYEAIHDIMDEIYRVLTPGGLMLHVEQPQYTDDMDLYEQFIRDWDALNNNEPFWSILHDMDMEELMSDAGFDEDNFLQLGVRAVTDDEDPTDLPENGEEPEDHGREAVWNVFGAWK